MTEDQQADSQQTNNQQALDNKITAEEQQYEEYLRRKLELAEIRKARRDKRDAYLSTMTNPYVLNQKADHELVEALLDENNVAPEIVDVPRSQAKKHYEKGYKSDLEERHIFEQQNIDYFVNQRVETRSNVLFTATAKSSGYERDEVRDVVMHYMFNLKQRLLAGEVVTLPGLGRLYKQKAKPRVFKSVAKNETYICATSDRIGFRPIYRFKSELTWARKFGKDFERYLLWVFARKLDGRITEEVYEGILKKHDVDHNYVMYISDLLHSREKNLRANWTEEQWEDFRKRQAEAEARGEILE